MNNQQKPQNQDRSNASQKMRSGTPSERKEGASELSRGKNRGDSSSSSR